MSEDIFDAIIVGAGLAGSVAALVLAREGAQVLVIERGNSAGAKNVTGGRLYAHSLEHIIPGFADSAPVERLITHEKLAFMTEKSAMTMDYCNGDETSPSQRSYSVLRSKFDAWLMEQAEEAGAQLITGIRVDNLVQRDGKVAVASFIPMKIPCRWGWFVVCIICMTQKNRCRKCWKISNNIRPLHR